jgi:cysteine synthase A
MKANSILDVIGNTPLLKINKLFAAERPDVEVWIKLERQNPGGSIKDRIALSMIEQAALSWSQLRVTRAWAWPWWLL